MEKNLHDDRLDDFVRKSFEGYEEDPAPDMWGRIEGDLSVERDRPPLWLYFSRHRWQVAAAAAVLLLVTTVVCQHLYYQDKLKNLTEMQVSSQNETAEKQLPKTNSGESTLGIIQKGDGEISSGNSTTSPSVEKQAKDLTKHAQGTQAPGIKKLGNTPPPQLPSSSSPLPSDRKPEGMTFGNTQEPSLANFKEEGEALPLHSVETTLKTIDLESIALESELLENPVTLPNVPRNFPIRPVKHSSGWYVGLQAMPLLTSERPPKAAVRPALRPLFRSAQKDVDYSNIWWLRVGKKAERWISFESGIGYQRAAQTTTHKPRFRFGDGSHQGQGPTSRTYRYDLSTYGGTAEVSLRMEDTNPGSTPSDDEPVSLAITAKESMEMLRVPLLLTARLGEKRFNAQIKAGLLANFFLKNELDLSARVSENSRFQPVAGRDGYTIQLAQPGKVFFGFMASAGAEFKLSPRLGLLTEISTISDFGRSDQSRQKLPRHRSFGANFGLNYYF